MTERNQLAAVLALSREEYTGKTPLETPAPSIMRSSPPPPKVRTPPIPTRISKPPVCPASGPRIHTHSHKARMGQEARPRIGARRASMAHRVRGMQISPHAHVAQRGCSSAACGEHTTAGSVDRIRRLALTARSPLPTHRGLPPLGTFERGGWSSGGWETDGGWEIVYAAQHDDAGAAARSLRRGRRG